MAFGAEGAETGDRMPAAGAGNRENARRRRRKIEKLPAAGAGKLTFGCPGRQTGIAGFFVHFS